MKKALLVIALLLLATQAKADDVQLPALGMGVGYSVKDSAPVFLGTFDVANYKGFNLEAGYAGRNKESLDEVAAVLSYKLVNQGALNFPILKYFSARVGVYGGLGRINTQDLAGAKFDWGPSVTGLVKVAF